MNSGLGFLLLVAAGIAVILFRNTDPVLLTMVAAMLGILLVMFLDQ